MSLLDKDKKIKNSSKKDKKTNDLIKNTLPLDEGMIIGFYPSDKNELKNNKFFYRGFMPLFFIENTYFGLFLYSHLQ